MSFLAQSLQYTCSPDFYKAIYAIRGKGSTRGMACAVNVGGQVQGQENTSGSVRLVTSGGCVGEHESQSIKVHRYSRKNMGDYKLEISNIIKTENFSFLLVNGNGNDCPKRLCVKYLANEEQKTDFTVYTISALKELEPLTLKYDQNTEKHNLVIPEDRFDFFLRGSPIIVDGEYFVGVLKESDPDQFNPCFITEEEFGEYH